MIFSNISVALHLLILLLLPGFILSAISSNSLSLCPLFDQTPCGLGLPAKFCCHTGQKCLRLAGNTTALCCPAGSNCSAINPISCNMQLQNVTLYPDTPVKTTALDLDLNKCGNMCCPFGFTCESSEICVVKAEQTSTPDKPISLTPTISLKSTATSSPALSTCDIVVMPAVHEKVCDKLPVHAVLTGFFPGLIIGIVISTLLCYILIYYHGSKHKRINPSIKFRYISDPQPVVMRSDFLRRQISQNPYQPSIETSSIDYAVNQMAYMFRRPSLPDFREKLETPLPPVPLTIRKSVTQQKKYTDTSQPKQRFPVNDSNFGVTQI